MELGEPQDPTLEEPLSSTLLLMVTFDDGHFKGTEEMNQFRQEYEMCQMKEDEGLDIIGEGLATLKNMASDMNEELDRQVPLMDEMEDKADRANADLKNTNVKLKETVLQCAKKVKVKRCLGITHVVIGVLKWLRGSVSCLPVTSFNLCTSYLFYHLISVVLRRFKVRLVKLVEAVNIICVKTLCLLCCMYIWE